MSTYRLTKEEGARVQRFIQAHPESAADVAGVNWFCLERAAEGLFIVEEAATQLLLAVSAWEAEVAS